MNPETVLDSVKQKQVGISVLGLGHVGLPTALGLAELGWRVTGADADPGKIAMLRQGQSPFYEPGLQQLLAKHIANPRFRLVDTVAEAIRSSAVLFVCVGTPQRESGEADLTQVEELARTIAANLNGYKLIVEKSTVPAITGQWVKRTIQRYSRKTSNGAASDPCFDVASNPEFLQEGKAMADFFHPDRIVCGVESELARAILSEIYGPLGRPVLFTDVSTAELIKHAANAFLATKISFINMVADLCDSVGADVRQVAEGIGLDPRIGRAFLNAGVGFGGYCFPKDLRAFIRLAEENGADASLLLATESVNESRIERFVRKVRQALWMLDGKTVGVLGLAFKSGTDDIRESPALRIAGELARQGARLRLYDPKAMENARSVLPEAGNFTYCADAYQAAEGAHALLILTEWDEFRDLDLERIRGRMELPVIVDGRNLLDPDAVRRAGLEYLCMGRRQGAITPGKPHEILAAAS
jgi:UDPglucose 6-dehydrogenase